MDSYSNWRKKMDYLISYYFLQPCTICNYIEKKCFLAYINQKLSWDFGLFSRIGLDWTFYLNLIELG